MRTVSCFDYEEEANSVVWLSPVVHCPSYSTNTVAFLLHDTFLIFALSSCKNSPLELVHQMKRLFKTSITAHVGIHIDFLQLW